MPSGNRWAPSQQVALPVREHALGPSLERHGSEDVLWGRPFCSRPGPAKPKRHRESSMVGDALGAEELGTVDSGDICHKLAHHPTRGRAEEAVDDVNGI
eukprot:4913243-Pyramimonas_sp.AAC.1